MAVNAGAKPITSNDLLVQARALESAFDKGVIPKLPHQTRIREANLAFIDAVGELPNMPVPELTAMLQQRAELGSAKANLFGHGTWIAAGIAILTALAGYVDPSLKSTLPHFLGLAGGSLGFLFGNVFHAGARKAAGQAEALHRDINEFVAGGQQSLVGVPLAELVAQTVDVNAKDQ